MNIFDLKPGWWAYFENTNEQQFQTRVSALKPDLLNWILGLSTNEQELMVPVIHQIESNLNLLPRLKTQTLPDFSSTRAFIEKYSYPV
ncbi:hypothetical protein WDW89_25945 [Deltaproteobacteria bacterium TL4]